MTLERFFAERITGPLHREAEPVVHAEPVESAVAKTGCRHRPPAGSDRGTGSGRSVVRRVRAAPPGRRRMRIMPSCGRRRRQSKAMKTRLARAARCPATGPAGSSSTGCRRAASRFRPRARGHPRRRGARGSDPPCRRATVRGPSPSHRGNTRSGRAGYRRQHSRATDARLDGRCLVDLIAY